MRQGPGLFTALQIQAWWTASNAVSRSVEHNVPAGDACQCWRRSLLLQGRVPPVV